MEAGRAGGALSDGQAHATTLAGICAIPPTGTPTVDLSADLPAPAALSLPGTLQLRP